MNRHAPKIFSLLFVILLVLIAIASVNYFQNHPVSFSSVPVPKPAPSPSVLGSRIGIRTKTTDCQVNGPLPDSACTPGAVFSGATREQVCSPGYSSSVRNVSTTVKNEVYRAYGIISHPTGHYEVDHLIPLELGGSNDVANLWPEVADPTSGFRQKDQVENFLHDQVCQGLMDLSDAQNLIASDWLLVLPSVSP